MHVLFFHNLIPKIKLLGFQNAYGYEFFSIRLRISSRTVTNIFPHGCGDSRNRIK